jgi:GGDEF domain-containing protein
MNDAEKILFLSRDDPFGILTRPALELTMSESKGVATLYVIDFNDIHKLNKEFGYEKVNALIRETIEILKSRFNGLIVGRIFSGDEIAIIDPFDYFNLIVNYAGICMNNGLGFKWVDSSITLGHAHAFHRSQLDTLSQKLQTSCYCKML